jgi:isocitrate lyase
VQDHTYAQQGAEKLWKLVNNEPYVNCLGALTGGQALQQVKAGVKVRAVPCRVVALSTGTFPSPPRRRLILSIRRPFT